MISVDELKAALEGLPDSFGVFSEDLQGDLEGLAFYFGVLGDGALSAADKFERFLGIIEKYSPEAAEALRGKTSDQQRRQFEEWARQLAEQGPELAATLAVLGISAAQLRAIVDAGMGTLDGTLGKTTGTQIARSITEIQAVEVVAWLEDIAMTLRQIRDRMMGQQKMDAVVAKGMTVAKVGAAASGSVAEGAVATSGREVVSIGDVMLAPGMTEEDFEEIWNWIGQRVYLAGRDPGNLSL